jgi:2-iminobutanoate/2-iminopropanoate deaminase
MAGVKSAQRGIDRGGQRRYTTGMKKIIVKPAAGAAAIGPYSQGVRAGDFLFCAGQIPVVPGTGQIAGPDARAQTERVLENIKIILQDQKLDFGHVVKTTVYLTDLADFAAMNEVYARYFTADFPARSTVQAAALPRGAKVEIEVVAHYD